MSEAQALISSPYFLKGSAYAQYRSVKYSSNGGVSSWPEAVQYLLRTYATPNAVREAVANLQSSVQKPAQSETLYVIRITHACIRCGNVYPQREKVTFFIDGIDATVSPLVAKHRERQKRDKTNFELIMHYAPDEGDARRARIAQVRRRTLLSTERIAPNKILRPNHAAMLVDSSEEF